MRSRKRLGFALATAALLLGPGKALAFDLGELQGKNADKAQEKLSQRGYSVVRSNATKKRAFQYWWSARDKSCALLVIDTKGQNQRVVEATKVGKKECTGR